MSIPRPVQFAAFAFMAALAISHQAFAEETFPAQARLFMATTSINPAELNQEMSSEGLKGFDGIGQIGVEITYPITRFLDVGMRYGRRNVTKDELSADTATAYQGSVQQDAILLLARLPILRTSLLKFDVFGGVGGSNTTFELKSASRDGTLSRKATDDVFASPILSYGASAGIGFKKFYLYVEGGFDRNRVTPLSSSGNMSGSVNSLELSGQYFMIGLLFDGISATKK